VYIKLTNVSSPDIIYTKQDTYEKDKKTKTTLC